MGAKRTSPSIPPPRINLIAILRLEQRALFTGWKSNVEAFGKASGQLQESSGWSHKQYKEDER